MQLNLCCFTYFPYKNLSHFKLQTLFRFTENLHFLVLSNSVWTTFEQGLNETLRAFLIWTAGDRSCDWGSLEVPRSNAFAPVWTATHRTQTLHVKAPPNPYYNHTIPFLQFFTTPYQPTYHTHISIPCQKSSLWSNHTTHPNSTPQLQLKPLSKTIIIHNFLEHSTPNLITNLNKCQTLTPTFLYFNFKSQLKLHSTTTLPH